MLIALQDLRSEVAFLEAEHAALKEEADGLRRAVDASRDTISNLTNEIETLRSDNVQINSEMEFLQSNNQVLQNLIAEKPQQSFTQQGSHEGQAMDTINEEDDASVYREQIATLEAALEAERAENQQQAAVFERKLREAKEGTVSKEDAEALRARCVQLEKKNDILASTVSTLEDERKKVDSELREVKKVCCINE